MYSRSKYILVFKMQATFFKINIWNMGLLMRAKGVAATPLRAGNKKGPRFRKPFMNLAQPAGFEPTTPWFIVDLPGTSYCFIECYCAALCLFRAVLRALAPSCPQYFPTMTDAGSALVFASSRLNLSFRAGLLTAVKFNITTSDM